ncbi:15046_t:CDS:2 [Cetraspora pellucida]|uniref:15046_t:CDS:1 n=1 Tax=Cetraspora pellucida TaxID=1433469 RepID=A0A9N9IBK6_9GLOM|nr:15046_t:CDS:2 [Cetraspora pellucida]
MSYGTNQGSYPGPPPAYSSVGTSHEPFVGREWETDDVPEDFKYGVSVSECDVSVRLGWFFLDHKFLSYLSWRADLFFIAFVRKVYSILLAQIGLTTIVSAIFMNNDNIKKWVQESGGILIVSMIATFVLLLLLMWKRRSYPTNYALLAAFTLAESYSIGTLVTLFDKTLVLYAFIITSFLFIGLSLFTLQSKYDFSGMAPFLFAGLWVVIIAGIIGIFVPFSQTWDLIFAAMTAILFSGFIIYDTFNIMKRLSPEEYVIASVDLYMDFINLFIAILRILNDLNRD